MMILAILYGVSCVIAFSVVLRENWAEVKNDSWPDLTASLLFLLVVASVWPVFAFVSIITSGEF